jgi:hypothetical protein
VRHWSVFALVVAIVSVAPTARADSPKAAVAFLTGASVFLVGFAVGGVLVATSNANDVQDNAGWLTMEGGFAVAPLAAHAVAGEWLRGLVSAALPMAAFAGTAILFAIHPATIEQGELSDQRVMWSFFGVGLFSGIAGVVDSAFADTRARSRAMAVPTTAQWGRSVSIAPVVGSGRLGLQIGGRL